jgi:hypothetical protein
LAPPHDRWHAGDPHPIVTNHAISYLCQQEDVGVADLIFPDYAIGRMRQRGISEDDVYLTVEDADDELERDDRRTEYVRMMDDGREITVVIEDDGETRTVVSLWNRKRRRPRRR